MYMKLIAFLHRKNMFRLDNLANMCYDYLRRLQAMYSICLLRFS